MFEDDQHIHTKYHMLIHQMIHGVRAHHRIIEKRIGEVGIHRGQRMLLLHLAKEGKALSQREIADKLDVTPASVARTLKQLSAEGYIRREDDTADSRRNTVQITEEGMRIVAETRRMFDSFDQQTFKGFTDAELDALSEMMDRILKNLAEIDESAFESAKRK